MVRYLFKCFICRPSDSTVSDDAGIELRNAGFEPRGCWDRTQGMLGSNPGMLGSNLGDAGIEPRL